MFTNLNFNLFIRNHSGQTKAPRQALGMWLDSHLGFSEGSSKGEDCGVHNKVRCPTAIGTTPPAGHRRLGYDLRRGSHLQRPRHMGETFRRGIDRVSRTTLGVLLSTPEAFLEAGNGSMPAKVRVNWRQEDFAARICSFLHESNY